MEAQDKPPQKRKKRSGKNRRKKCKSAEQEDPLPLPPKASLLGLPGELQNKIFRFVLLEPDRIYVDATWVKRYYECEAPGMDNFDFTSSPGPGILHRDDRHMVVSRVFRIADVFLKYKVAWEAVEEALEEFRVAVAYKDSSWSWT
ncbi:hypothetical protein LTR65_007156 [Meristemomyces frigidus]